MSFCLVLKYYYFFSWGGGGGGGEWVGLHHAQARIFLLVDLQFFFILRFRGTK